MTCGGSTASDSFRRQDLTVCYEATEIRKFSLLSSITVSLLQRGVINSSLAVSEDSAAFKSKAGIYSCLLQLSLGCGSAPGDTHLSGPWCLCTGFPACTGRSTESRPKSWGPSPGAQLCPGGRPPSAPSLSPLCFSRPACAEWTLSPSFTYSCDFHGGKSP